MGADGTPVSPPVICCLIACATILAYKLIDVATETPYRYEVSQIERRHPRTGQILDVSETIYRFDERTGDVVIVDPSAETDASVGTEATLEDYVDAAFESPELSPWAPIAILILFFLLVLAAAAAVSAVEQRYRRRRIAAAAERQSVSVKSTATRRKW